MIAEADLLARFDSVKRLRGDDWMARCPTHEDRTPSLHITNKGDHWALYCLTDSCDHHKIRQRLGLTREDLGWTNGNGHRREVETYSYTDEDGRPLFEVVRFDPKEFRQRRPDGTWGIKDVRRVLYRLPRVLEQARQGGTVYVVEGERDVHALERAGAVATTCPMGAGKWRHEYSEALAGADVIVVADRDEPGRQHARRVVESIGTVAKSVRVVEAAAGKDAADHLRAGKTLDDFEPVHLSNPLGNGQVGTPSTDRYEGRVVDLDALLSKPPQPIPWRVHDVVADGTLTIISGESGAGKSWLVQAFCTGVGRGRAVAGLPCAKGAAVYIDAEMGPRMFVDQRLRPTGATAASFHYVDAMGLDLSTPEDLGWVRGQIEHMGANLVVIDSLRRLTPSKSENDSDDMAPVVAALAKLARDTNTAIVLVHHKGDSEKFFRGSTAIKDQADALFALLRDPDDEHAPRRFRCRGGRGKMRYSLEPADVYLDISPEDGGVAVSDPPEDPGPQVSAREAIAAAIKAALPAKTKKEIADKTARRTDDKTFRDAWNDLRAGGELVEINGFWVGGGTSPPLGIPTTTPPAEMALASQNGGGNRRIPEKPTTTPLSNGNGNGNVVSNGNGWQPHMPDEDAPDWWPS